MLRRLLFVLLMFPFFSLARAADGLPVFVTVAPLETFVSRIGGEHVRVDALVRPGQDPHAYEPTARQIAALADAELYVRVGLGFEDAWVPRLLAANPGMRVLDARDGLEVRPADKAHDHGDRGHDHDHGDVDPHVWTSPARVKIMGARIRDALADLAPEYAADFAANYDRFAADLDTLDAEIRARLAGMENRRFMVYHPAWGYFAEDYALEQVAIEHEGKEPGARALTAMIEQARREGIRVIFVQPQLNPASAEQVARSIDGQVAAIDPLSGDYFENLRQVAALIAGDGAP
ncbi:metal ABC transporter solute-binding protein, Zn/Mn family [Thiocapsa marina]|uniref:High-affinity zinc uptake system protein ZnuA n=1 Tax=Thiocapsa marina 5811 TaxID=768671 RepID=F9UF15_9GAMM|nr:zinc ABC transporter substrate-binding protein [Thiocapsa marina]EGV17052.1 ABC-type metal ion transporter, periplasmic subunit [Thiocapsa marina 5811]